MTGERTPSRAAYLRRPWTAGRISGRTFKGGLLLALAILVYLLLLSETGWLRQWQLQQRKAALLGEIDRLAAEADALAREADRLRLDPEHRERVAREEWGYKRPDERIYHLRRGK